MNVAFATARLVTCANGSSRRVLHAALEALLGNRNPVLAVVVETEGSTYSGEGSLALFDEDQHFGWISGGCLELEIALRARQAAEEAAVHWLDIDTREDSSLFSGGAVGCRGRQKIALVPLKRIPGAAGSIEAWLAGQRKLNLTLCDGEHNRLSVCDLTGEKDSLAAPSLRPDDDAGEIWSIELRNPPEALILGTGPEAPMLIGLLHDLGWLTTPLENRPRWRAQHTVSWRVHEGPIAAFVQSRSHVDVALVMHHNFELDLEALDALAKSPVPFIGLLGPTRRREDLFRLLPAAAQVSLTPRLRSPVGLHLGGRGPEGIALSIAAQLQAWRHGALP